ncbi:serine/threonine-protein kinase PknK [Polyangium aurulentum]|uniref:serine/threonine-protein kinase n=1 Tax=Polyangium aurulentum TaxID=2567896 RepID=UPI0010AE3902|nr:serine/threonine-protein kinase [Polyangium aurulentum]UQA61709.1 protein kinase [Polyangium aurulentum]
MQGSRWLQRGARVGDYTIEGLLGEGGFGAVFRARSDSGVRAALKVFKTTGGELTAERLISQQNEIEALLRLDHPSLVTLYGYGFLEGVGLFLAMELVEGETLDAYLDRVGQLDTLEAVRIVRKVAEALAHSHARGVLHLDLKPSNIVISEPHEPRIKVLDFGLATLTSSWLPDDTRVTAGTVGYMAPECLRSGRARPDPRMDLYALGTILYELLSGRLPFRGRGQRTLMMQRAVGELIPLRDVLPGVAPAMAALVDELLTQDPTLRPASAAQLCARLKEIYYETLRGEEHDHEHAPLSVRPPPSGRSSMMSLVPPRPGAEEVPFVGRDGELSALASRVLGATSHGAEPVVVVGDAGIGKSRLIAELLNVVEGDGAAVVAYGRCRELSALVPYSPLREALSRIATATKRKDATAARVQAAISAAVAEDADLLRALVPELAGAPPDGDVRRNLLRPAAARRVAELVRRLVTSIAMEVPVLVAIEDLHWGDESTLAVLDILSRSLEGSPVLLLGTSRPPVRVAWTGAEVMELGPLDRDENARLLQALGRGADEDVLRELERHVPLLGAGNPLFNIQVIRNLELEGFVGRTAIGTLCLTSRNLADYNAPTSIADALRRGVDSLSEAAIKVLGVASLFGRQFLRTDLRALGLFDETQVEHALREAEQRCLCRDDGGGMSFVHEVVLEQLERRMGRAGLRGHHLRIARQLERRGADAATLARHLERAGEAMRAASAYVEAALGAKANDPTGASQGLKRAIELVEALPPSSERSRIMLTASAELARARSMLGGTEELLRLLERCADDVPPGASAMAELAAALARVHYARGDLPAAVACAERALEAVGEEPGLERHRCAAVNVIGRAHAAAGRVREALGALEEACRLTEATGDLTDLCHSRGVYGLALGRAGRAAEATGEMNKAAELADRLHDAPRLLGTWLCCALFAEARYDWELGVGSTAQLLSYAEEHKLSGHYLYMGTMLAGRHQFHMGHLQRARMLVSNALNLSRIVGTTLGRAEGQAFLGDVHLVEGQLAEAEACYARAIEIGSSPASVDESAVILGLVGRMQVKALGRGDAADVQRLGAEARARVEASGNRSLFVGLLQRWAESLEDVGRREDAAALWREHASLCASLELSNPDFWPRIPDAEARASGDSPRSYWLGRRGKTRGSGEWMMVPTQRVSPSVLLTARAVGSMAQIAEMTQRSLPLTLTMDVKGVALDSTRTAPRTGRLLEALATVEGFVPVFDEPAGT